MRYSTSKYVQVLYETLDGKNEKEVDLVISNFISLLVRNKHIKYAPKIISEFNKFYNKKNGISEVQVVSRETLTGDTLEKIRSFYKKFSGVSEVKIKETLNTKMLGGVILKTDEEILDGSIDRKLSNMRKQLLGAVSY